MPLSSGRTGLRVGLVVAAIVLGIVVVRLVIGAFLQLIQLAVVGAIALVVAYAGYRLWTGWTRGTETPAELHRQR